MWDLNYNLNKLFILILFLCFGIGAWASEDDVLNPLRNKGLLLIEKEMIRFSDIPKKQWKIEEQKMYRSLLFLEEYYLSRGVSSWSMKVLDRIVTMRNASDDLKKKAFLDCEAWRVLDYDLKNNEKKGVLADIMSKRKFSNLDHVRFRKFTSDKVASCVGLITPQWTWIGRDYSDLLYDVKAQNAVNAVQSYIRIRNVSASP